MSDVNIPLDGTEACSVCGQEVLAAIAITMPPIAQIGGYATCPAHVDTVIARLQDNVHETMAAHEGPLVDWWDGLHPPGPDIEVTP